MSRKQKFVSLTPPGAAGPLRVLADGALFFLILSGLLFSVCSAYGLEVNRRGLLGVCALLAALTLPLYSLRRRRWILVLALAALYAFLGWRYQDALVAGACVAADQVLQTLDIALRINLVWMTGGPTELLWFLSMAAALLCIPLGWAVIRGRSAALTLVLTLPWLIPAMLAEILPDWLPLMALTAGWCVLLLSGLCCRDDPAGGARFALISLPAVAAMLALLSALLPRAGYQRPAWTDTARTALSDTALEFVGQGGALGGVASLLSGGDQVSERLDNAGPRSFQNRVVLEVQSDYTGRLYLRGNSTAVYTGVAWEALSDDVYQTAGLNGDAAADPLNGYEPLNFPAMTAAGLPYYEMTITYPASLSGWMYTPYQLATTPSEISDVTFVNDSHLERRFGIREKNLFFIPDALPSVSEAQQTWAAAEAEAYYRSFVYDHYLDTPENFADTFQRWYGSMPEIRQQVEEELLRQAASSIYSPYSMQLTFARMVARLLELSTRYDLNTPYTPDGEDFVDYFLTESAVGYCVHYASAGTLLLRYLGIPARYVTGYTVEVPASGHAEVLDSDAHAWVEIYLDGYGWYPVEMTPATGTGITSEAPMLPENAAPAEPSDTPDQPTAAPEPSDVPETSDPEPTTPTENTPDSPEAETPQQGTGNPESGQGTPGWLQALCLLVLAAVLTPLQAQLRAMLRRRRFRDPDTNRAVVAAYGWLEQLQPWGADPDAVLGEAARKARFSQHRLTEEERAAALAAAEEARRQIAEALPGFRRFWLRWVRGL